MNLQAKCTVDDGKEKVLFAGDVRGRLSNLYTRVGNVCQRFGKFNLLFCVGDFFGDSCPSWNQYKDGSCSVPIPTYILGPMKTHQSIFYTDKAGNEIAPNISYLGPYGVFTTANGLRIAYISGLERGAPDCIFTYQNVFKLRELCKRGISDYVGIDILVTNQWPTDIIELDDEAKHRPVQASEMLSWLVSEIMPRYHFAGCEGEFYERPPFTHLDTMKNSIITSTRFIALAFVGNPEKKQCIFAISVKPLKDMKPTERCIQSVVQTAMPFKNLEKVKGIFEKNKQYFFQVGGQKRELHPSTEPAKRPRPAHTDTSRSGCWFCLSDPNIERHLIISIGKHAYLALAKGGLVDEHIIISSIGHVTSMNMLHETGRIEIFHYKEVLKKYFAKKNKIAVFYERNFRTLHLQIQVVPLPMQLASKIRDMYETAAEQQNMKFEHYPKETRSYLLVSPQSQYFHLELPDGTELMHRIQGKFPMHFGRDVLVQQNALNLSNKADWHNCLESKEKEISLVELFKKNFAPYDFTLDHK